MTEDELTAKRFIQDHAGAWHKPSPLMRDPHSTIGRSDAPMRTALSALPEAMEAQDWRKSGSIKPRLNKTETRARDILRAKQYHPIWEQAITLALDPPFRSYRPDLAYWGAAGIVVGQLVLIEIKGPHRFREKGIAKAALAAKTYPQFRFELWDWKNGAFTVTIMTP